MTITAIKAQVKKSDRVSVFIDGIYSVSLTQSQLLDEKLFVGLEIDDTRLATLKKASDFGKLYERIMHFIMIRPRSRRELELYCQRKNYTAEDCAKIIEKLLRLGYVNDARFAKAWVESRRLTKPMSIRALRAELRQKGISDDDITAALDASDYNEAIMLRKLIGKKQRLTRYKDHQKLLQYLAHQGFSYDAIQSALQKEKSF